MERQIVTKLMFGDKTVDSVDNSDLYKLPIGVPETWRERGRGANALAANNPTISLPTWNRSAVVSTSIYTGWHGSISHVTMTMEYRSGGCPPGL